MYDVVVRLPVVMVQDTRGYAPLPSTHVVIFCEHSLGKLMLCTVLQHQQHRVRWPAPILESACRCTVAC